MPAPLIELATGPADIEAVRGLFLEYAASLGVDLEYQDFSHEVNTLPGEYVFPRGTLMLARDDRGGRAIACVAVRPLDQTTCEIKRLYVRREGRGRGLGRTLAEAAIGFARGAGYDTMRLDTLPGMMAAQALYREIGFREIGPYRFSPVEGNVFMELDLRSPRPNASPPAPDAR